MEEVIKMLPKYKVHAVKKRINKRKTHEKYVAELAIKNPTVEVVDKYIGANKKITHHCLVHDIYWEVTPSNVLRGDGCKICHKERISFKNAKKSENYITELAIKNPQVEVVESYINSKTKIMHHCLIHNIYWKTSPDCALRGGGCEICHKEKLRDSKIKTHEQYLAEVQNINPNIIVLEKYDGANIPILHKCKIHNVQWKVLPASILQGCGCKKCGIEKFGANNRKSHEQYVEELNKTNSQIIVLENYINALTPILHKCTIDGYEWSISPSNILFGYGCPKCAGNIQKTQEQYIKEVFTLNANIEVVGQYINAKTPILHNCLIDGYKWNATPSSILRGTGCPKCSGTLKKTHDEYVMELSIINPDIKVIEQYVNMHTPIMHKCLIDKFEWYAIPNNLIHRGGCPQCHESSGERKVRQWLEKQNIKYIFQQSFKDCRDINPLPFDFYLPEYNSCIEYDDKQHFEPIDFFGGQEEFEYIVKHDNIKNEYCKNNGISLLRIPYFKNVEEELNNFLFI